MSPRKTKTSREVARRFAPARRFTELRAILESTGGASIYEIGERLGVEPRTVKRYLVEMQAAHEPLYADVDGKKKVWRLMATARRGTISLSRQQMVSLYLSRKVFDFLEGTGFKDDLDDIFAKLEALLKKKDFDAARSLDKKFHDVNEAAHIYDERVEDVDELVTAILEEEKLDVEFQSARGTSRFVIHPYTLLVYKKGLYVLGFSEKHDELRTFALDGFRAMERRRGQRFKVPEGYDPAAHHDGAFGLIKGPITRVVLRFASKVTRSVKRRRWHKTQAFEDREGGGIDMTLVVAGVEELKNWILSFGSNVEVVEPDSLRVWAREEAERIRAKYVGDGG